MPNQNIQIKNQIEEALLKKAVGYLAKETVEEYQINDNEQVLIKKKVAYKSVPPDISAAKLLLESFAPKSAIIRKAF